MVERRTESRDRLQIWHRRMGHVNFRDLVNASKTRAIHGVILQEKTEDVSCEVCFKGKMTRPPFLKETDRNTTKLELIHMWSVESFFEWRIAIFHHLH